MMLRGVMVLAAVGLGLVSPNAAQAEGIWAGVPCHLASTDDPTGQVIQDPNTQTGVLTGGPWGVVPTDGFVSHVTITCTVKINDGANNGIGGTSRMSTTSGEVGVLVDTISYTALPGDDVYLCTRIWWCDHTGCWHVIFDPDDDPSNGYQCELLTTIEAR